MVRCAACGWYVFTTDAEAEFLALNEERRAMVREELIPAIREANEGRERQPYVVGARVVRVFAGLPE